MELEILKLVYDYTVNRKIADTNFLNKLIGIIVTSRNLDNYVSEVGIINKLVYQKKRLIVAEYNFLTMSLDLYYPSIKKFLELMNDYDPLFTPFEQLMYRNLKLTSMILHELEHAYQNKQANDINDNSLQNRIVKVSGALDQKMKLLKALLEKRITLEEFNEYTEEHKKAYYRLYNLNPYERLAQINSFQTILRSTSSIKTSIPNLYEFELASLAEEMLKGYPETMKQGSCPTETYLYSIKEPKLWTSFEFYSQNPEQLFENVSVEYSLKDRLSLGLPVSESEYTGIHEWLQNSNKMRR